MPKYMFLVLIVGLGESGCAIHYHNDSDNSDHIFGLGHMAMRISNKGTSQIAVAKEVSSLGSSIHIGKNMGISLGWSDEEEVQIFDESSQLKIERPSGSFLFSAMINDQGAAK